MKRVVMTGPTGAIGMALIEYLSNRDVQVIAVVRGNSKRKNQIKESEKVLKVECALAEMVELPQRIQTVIERRSWDRDIPIDVFYHFAWDGTFGDSRNDMYMQNRNVTYALDAVSACKTVMSRMLWMQ